ncbi:MAG: hypothetical protein CVU34_00395 [Betaproteobacteria bacterium HGW-Betaproteobacteria-7]|jgi:hypothetical protein|nr:MAG: hypothetical protein CVU34_00395 [Betaproteobacteria bacterium HGW-Betaproteobacteria-7]
MIYLDAIVSQQFAPADLPAAIRAALGKPLRRAPVLAQLAVLGALACLPAERRSRPTALLWQSTSGPRLETLELLDEVCQGSGEPMPFTFLATVPASAAVQLRPFVPGLRSASTLPLDTEQEANWRLLLTIAANWLAEGRYEQVLCAHLDHWADCLSGHWLALSASPSASTLATLRTSAGAPVTQATDTPDFPVALGRWLSAPAGPSLQLHSPAAPGLTVEFART